MSAPYLFDEFFASGQDETISPFLTPSSRRWGKNLALRNSLIAAALLLIAFCLSFFSPTTSHLFLASVYFLVGTPALLNTFEDLKSIEINIDVLMTLAAFLSILIGSGMEGALLLVLFSFSAAMEDMVTEKTKSALMTLQRLSPKQATVIEKEGVLVQKAVDEIAVGTQILIRAGELIPLDGQVISGSSFINLVHLTGESQPQAKRKGDEVPAGAHNLDGTLTVVVQRSNADSTLSKIVHLITKAQEAKPKIERLFDRFSKTYSMSIIGLAALFALTLPWLLSIPFIGTEGSIYRALTFLIAASPCALIIATPTAYLSALSSCAKRGIVLKGGTILDRIASCTLAAFDKTGTLTTGQLSCSGIESLNSPAITSKIALAIAASLERHSTHPIAKAICAYAEEEGIQLLSVEEFKSVAGYGLQGEITIEQQKVTAYIGHPDFIQQKKPFDKKDWESQNTFLLVGDSLFVFHFVDQIREEAKETLSKLQEEIDCVMLTGDHTKNAQQVAETLNISNVYANLRPEDKLDKVAELSRTKGLLMVGDGINDAPALTRASVGVSMGKIGSATAVQASDAVILHDDLTLIPFLFNKSKKTTRIVKQNLTLALAVICLATTPALLGYIPLWLAVILHEGGTVLVGFNSLRLLK